ncbi:MAG TPA: bifunctional DNA-formamidopyrimidine glycosylase/DNA-(apurinic or apyrimidinic site) lyase [Candidatus Omnitrophota bacterium]|nr:bifunctional DNA-formamidopyrimidine glycosylase/DNA-(apurinic or apyrimidinic site) lyase [Candidatus Omnitrophota bacterium]
MPELPEVETIRLDLQKVLPGLRITDISVYDQRILKTNDQPTFIKEIKDKTIQSVSRRGKMIVMPFKEGGYLLVHLKMTGQLIYGQRLKLKETKLVFGLSDGNHLNYNDQRLFGRLSFVQQLNDDAFLREIGPEPLEASFNEDWIKGQLKRRRIPIKTFLLNQNFIAGIGNIYASEILFDARINPTKAARRLTREEIASLRHSTVHVLKKAIKYRGTSMRNYRDSNGEKGRFINRIKVYNKEHESCPICHSEIKRIVQNGRSTFFCQRCQH